MRLSSPSANFPRKIKAFEIIPLFFGTGDFLCFGGKYAFSATFLQKGQNEGTSKPGIFKDLEDSLLLNFAATFFADLSVSSTQSAAALADFLVVQPCIDIHRRGEVRVSQHALQYLWWDFAAVGCDSGVAMTQLMSGKGGDTDLFSSFIMAAHRLRRVRSEIGCPSLCTM